MFLEENIKGLCSKHGLDFVGFLSDLDAEHVDDLRIYDLHAICEEYGLDFYSLLFKPLFKSAQINAKLQKIKLLVLDVDGVMTDGGMYFTELGDQIKKYNTKDGMAIMHLTSTDFPVAIISSGFTSNIVQQRAEMLKIKYCFVTRERKLDVLQKLIENLGMKFDNVAMIGDDINDLEVMKTIGLAVCPSDAVQEVKNTCHIVLSKAGGDGCVREFIDGYLLNEPLK